MIGDSRTIGHWSPNRVVYEEKACACGCGRTFRSGLDRSKYFSETCRAKVYNELTKARRAKKRAKAKAGK